MDENEEIKVEQYILGPKSLEPKKPVDGIDNRNWAALLSPIIVVIVAIVFYNLGAGKFSNKDFQAREEQISKLHEVIQMIEENYVDSVEVENLYKTSIEGMLKQLDPHSAYIPIEDVEASQEELQGHFAGVGIRFLILRDTLMVSSVVEGGPAQMAGIKSGDRIIKVDDEVIASKGLTIEGVHDRLKGKPETKILISVIRKEQKKPIIIPVTRGIIPLPSVDAAYKIEGDIGIIKISNFSNNTDSEFSNAVKDLKSQGVTKLIVDLRNNGGGYMHTAINVADEFLKKNELIVFTQGIHQPKQETFATSYGQCEKMPTVVLINSGSASASEIVSGALQDNDRALIIGRRSFGKGLVQRPMKMTDGSELRLTVSRYYTPTGRSIQKPYGEGIDYEAEFFERYESGELQHMDSSFFKDAPQFKTKKGKVVYGGGGIMPDIFVPIDTTGSSLYFTTLTYTEAFRNFCFDYLDVNRKKMVFSTVDEFDRKFVISDQMLMDFAKYAEKTEKITVDLYGFNHSKERMKNYLKGELATYLFDFGARFYIALPYDKEVQVAIEELKKMLY
jgi:carboxyl-terminal processing protease